MQYLLQHSRFCGLKCDAVTLVRLLRAYAGLAYNRAPRSGDLVQQCHVGRTQAMGCSLNPLPYLYVSLCNDIRLM